MLNPELIKKYGDGIKRFFDELRNSISDDVADKCYTVDNGRCYIYDEVVVPVYIAVCTDYDTCHEVQDLCFDISSRLIDISTTATGDDFVMCLPYSVSKAAGRGIKYGRVKSAYC